MNHYLAARLSACLFGLIICTSCSKKGSNSPTPNNTPKPTITALNVNTGPYNTIVIITGTGFNTTLTADQVFFNGKVAVVTAATATQLTATVPLAAGTGKVTISVNNSAVADGPTFTYIPSYIVSNIAGSGLQDFVDGTGTEASFKNALGIAIDKNGNIYVADRPNAKIRKITPAGVVSTYADNAVGTTGVAVDGAGNVYYTELEDGLIKKISPAGVVTTFAGGGHGISKDGLGTAAFLGDPYDITIDKAGNLYVSDEGDALIRKITPAGLVTTLAGSLSSSYPPSAINGQGAAATFSSPTGIAVGASGNIYVADLRNNMIRKITSGGLVSTLAGSGKAGSDDGLGTAASFNSPTGVAVDQNGNVYVADQDNDMIRKISAEGMVTTIVRKTNSNLRLPADLVLNANGDIYFTNNGVFISKISFQ
jgi:sugar lactone lactonase YvrE